MLFPLRNDTDVQVRVVADLGFGFQDNDPGDKNTDQMLLFGCYHKEETLNPRSLKP